MVQRDRLSSSLEKIAVTGPASRRSNLVSVMFQRFHNYARKHSVYSSCSILWSRMFLLYLFNGISVQRLRWRFSATAAAAASVAWRSSPSKESSENYSRLTSCPRFIMNSNSSVHNVSQRARSLLYVAVMWCFALNAGSMNIVNEVSYLDWVRIDTTCAYNLCAGNRYWAKVPFTIAVIVHDLFSVYTFQTRKRGLQR